jgi:hypothetical protein
MPRPKPMYEVVAEFHHPPIPIAPNPKSPVSDDEVFGVIKVEEVRWNFDADNNDEAIGQAQKKIRTLAEKFIARMVDCAVDKPSFEEKQDILDKIIQHCVKIKKVRQIKRSERDLANKKTGLIESMSSALLGVLVFLISWFLISRLF